MPATKSKTEEAKPTVAESVYTAGELAEGCGAFGVPREIVIVALKRAGLQTATFTEAKRLIDNFKKEVK